MTIDELKALYKTAQQHSADKAGTIFVMNENGPATWLVVKGIIEVLEGQQKELRRLDDVKLQAVSLNQQALEELIRKIVKEESNRTD